jgi:hypothetical protein
MRSMPTQYENLREFLDSDYASLPDPQVKTLLARHGYDAEAMEGFFDDLKKVATSVGQVALKAAPSVISVAAPLIGTAFGGPIGGAIGGSLGSLASGALASATGQRPPAGGAAGGLGSIFGALTGGSPAGGAAGGLGSIFGALTGGSPAAGGLLQNLLKPQTISALGQMALGGLGKSSVPVGGQEVPVGGFLNMLKTFIGNAEAEYLAAQAAADAALPEYLRDYSGQAAGDVANDSFRAERLSELLDRGEAQEGSEAAEQSEGAEWEAMEAEYDAVELLEAEWDAYEFESEDA